MAVSKKGKACLLPPALPSAPLLVFTGSRFTLLLRKVQREEGLCNFVQLLTTEQDILDDLCRLVC